MVKDRIIIKGAREHNLKNIDLELPRDKLVVLTGVSGSGKSSLAFDTLYAEGQRRYVESLSSYARQFLGQMEKPKVDYIGGLSPAIAIEQKSASKNPRSTVGTVTEIYDYLRVLYARVGVPHCHQCGRPIGSQTAQQMVDRVLQLPPGTRFMVLAPVVSLRKGEYQEIFADARAEGFSRVRVDGEVRSLHEEIKLNKKVKHSIEIVVDRLQIPDDASAAAGDEPAALVGLAERKAPYLADGSESAQAAFVTRLTDSIETALRLGDGRVIISVQRAADEVRSEVAPQHRTALTLRREDHPDEWTMSENFACTHCGISFQELTPQMFSFNAPQGACPTCAGLGTRLEVDPDLIVPNPELSLHEGAVVYWGELRKKKDSWGYRALLCIAQHYGFDLDTPWKDLPERVRQVLLYGSGRERIRFAWDGAYGSGSSLRTWEGLSSEITRRFHQTGSDGMQEYYRAYMSEQPCPACGGAKLRPESLAVTVGGLSIKEMTALTIDQAYAWACKLSGTTDRWYGQIDAAQLDARVAATERLSDYELAVAGEVLKEIRERLGFLLNVGLHYLTLDRAAPSLSGGETQRIRLASQIGSGLVGVMYILDEPSIGLHQRDNRKLIDTLLKLRDLGNTVLVVEHDEETIRTADWVVDFGPRAGVHGGQVVAEGPPEQIARSATLTGAYLSGRLQIAVPAQRRQPTGWLHLRGAQQNNLREIDVDIPLGVFVAVTGVSGSGKSSLISETLYPALAARLNRAQLRPGKHRALEGLEQLDKVIDIDQSPIGRTPRSNPATYVKLFDLIREVFAQTPEARLRGYDPGRFSFNLKGGRCEACEGNGEKKIEMHFLADVWVRCDVCKGKRYNRETLQVRYKGKTIADVLDMDVQTALEFFENVPRIRRILQTLHDVGLDYIKLGQSATTLSGGEAQRVKLAKELCRVATGRTIYILDEPTTGLHFADVQNLLTVLHRLVAAGNTVIVIEHNLDVIKTADWIIDMGPEGGAGGGLVVAQGTPEQVAQVAESHTGRFLRELLAPASAANGSGDAARRPERNGQPTDGLLGAAQRQTTSNGKANGSPPAREPSHAADAAA
ncbi:excinuclease ABC subunit UvrA [Kallotenue papyrolyticum]|uniref:excinuclease ABC subunit UvrA n=1 Tax=Kallotenue papyrolyticum TaxID=1325125 RepID=UPI00047855C0|nr:excinuclease ABC subunit UvrA [Kallotenue papyrolyticum]